jgi:hypothetical protein
MIDMNSIELVVTNPVAVYFYNIERLPKEQYVCMSVREKFLFE